MPHGPEPSPPRKPRKPRPVRPDDRPGPRTVPTPAPKPVRPDDRPGPRTVPTPARPDAEVLRRQRLLRAAGYPVVVDGVWGAASVAAWARYTAKKPPLPVVTSDIHHHDPPQVRAANAQAAQAIRRARIAARKAQEMAGAQAVAARVSARARAAVAQLPLRPAQQAAVDARRHGLPAPIVAKRQLQQDRIEFAHEQTAAAVRFANAARAKRPEDLNTRELVAITVDPLTGHFDPQNPHDVRVIQRFLRSHGHNDLKVDGVYGRTTNQALVHDLTAFQNHEAEVQRHAVVDRLYKPALIRPGDPGFPILGTAPEPGKLLEVLRGGGFSSETIFDYLVKRAFAPDARFVYYRQQQLRALERQLLGRFTPGKFVHESLDVTIIRDALAISGVGEANKPGDIGTQQVAALIGARSSEDLHRRLLTVQLKDEGDFRRSQAARAGHQSWWQKGLAVVAFPGEWMRHQFVQEYEFIADSLDHPKHLVDGTDTYDSASRRADRALEQFAASHPWLNLGFEMVVDPLNLTGGLPTALFRGAALGAVRAERLGYAIIRGSELIPVAAVRAPAELLAHGAAFGLIVPASVGRLTHDAALASAALATRADLAHGYLVQRMLHGVEVATRAKALTVAYARDRVGQAARFGFERGLAVGGRDIAEFKHGETIAVQLRDGDAPVELSFDETSRNIAAAVFRAFPHLIAALRDHSVSIWASHERRQLSTFGGALTARLAESARAAHIRTFAADSAHKKFWAHLGVPDFQPGLDYSAVVTNASPALRAEAERAAREEYADIIRRAGTSRAGGGDPDIAIVIQQRVERSMDHLMRSIFPEIQNHLDLSVLGLFDESGLWAERGGDLSDLVRRLALESFDDVNTHVIPNPRAGRDFTESQKDDLVNLELSDARRRYEGAAGRAAAAGEPKPQDWVDEMVVAKTVELTKAWKKVGLNRWRDLRPEIEESHLYLRHRPDVLDPERGSTLGVDEIASIAQNPVVASGGQLDSELEQLGWTIAAAVTTPETVTFARQGVDFSGDRVTSELRSALERRTALLDAAFDQALPQQLFRDFAVWQALARAQSRRFRYPYKVLKGLLNTWLVATLPFLPGFAVRNVVDNTAKALVAGARDPRLYFYEYGRSIFHLNLRAMRYVLSIGHRFEGNPAVHYFDDLMETVWQHSDETLSRLFDAHGVPIPEHAIQGMRNASIDFSGEKRTVFDKMRDGIWELMAAGPENTAKRVVYRDTYLKAIRDGASEETAFRLAADKVDHVLFDYSKISTLEDNLRFIFPFAFFWQRTTKFWFIESWDKPWLPLQFALFEDRLQNEIHAEWPEWMRRYVSADVVTDQMARVPGLRYLAPSLGSTESITDPANFLSFNVLYRTFKGANPDLPPEKSGIKFLSGFVDAINDWGLSMNPLVRKPLELAGVLNLRSWQAVFPQTQLIQAFTRSYLSKRFPNGLNIEAWAEDKLLQSVGSDFSVTDKLAQNFNQYVQREMAAQIERGEPADRKKAEEKMRDFFLVQAIVGYGVGLYVRQMDQASFRLYQIADQLRTQELDFRNLSAQEQKAYRAFTRRKFDPVAFDQYLETVPLVEAYYSIQHYGQAQEFKQQHPEIQRYVEPVWSGRAYTETATSHIALTVDTQAAFRLFQLVDDLNLPFELRKEAEQMLVTPKMRAAWAANDTPREMRDRMLRGQYFHYLRRLTDTFHAIPETDFDARNGFLREHPILEHWWAQNNEHSDDLRTVINASNATLRDRYFEYVEGHDWNGATKFLHRFPFIFEFTRAAGRVDANGDWIGSGGRRGHFRGRHTMSEHARDYLAARAQLNHFFALLKGDKAAAQAWLNGDSPDAKIVRAYFRKYAHPRGTSQHARDYLEAKDSLDYYFKLLDTDKAAAHAWLRGHSEGALKVSAYFKKYGHLAKLARKWGDHVPSGDPDIQARLRFWQRYWRLPPDERPAFVLANAEKSGVFIYGPFGAQERADREQRYLREAKGRGIGLRDALYLRVAPLLELFFNLQPENRALFLKANPDVADYLDRFAGQTTTGDKKLDAIIEHYFSLPADSPERSVLLERYPKLQRYFDAHSTKADRAMHRLLDVYFQVPPGPERKRFLALHPEIQAYFDKRHLQRTNENASAMAFDLADPRLADLRERAAAEILTPGLAMAESLRQRRHHDLGLLRGQVPTKP